LKHTSQTSVFKRATSHFFSAHPPNGLLAFFNPIGFGIGKIISSLALKLSDKLKSFGFHESKADASIFVFKTKTTIVYILVYVDDILINNRFKFRCNPYCNSIFTEQNS